VEVVGLEPTSGISLKRAPTGLAKEIFWGRVLGIPFLPQPEFFISPFSGNSGNQRKEKPGTYDTLLRSLAFSEGTCLIRQERMQELHFFEVCLLSFEGKYRQLL